MKSDDQEFKEEAFIQSDTVGGDRERGQMPKGRNEEWNGDSQPTRCRVQNTEYGLKIKEEVKATQSEIKKNIQGTNSEEKEARVQINDLEHKEGNNIQ